MSLAPPVAPPLRWNARFQLLWMGSAVALLGIEAADVGYPLALLALTGSPARAALFGLAQTVANLLGALPAGYAVDRVDRGRLLQAAEGIRALAAGSVAVAFLAGRLTLTHLLLVAAVLGAGAAFGGPARMLVLRATVPAEQLTAALAQEQARDGAAMLVGPPLGGLLYGLRQALPFLFSAVALGLSWLVALLVRVPARSSPAHGSGDAPESGGMLTGLRVLLGDPTLRAATAAVAALNAVGAPLALVAVVLLRRQAVPPWQIGLAMAGFAVGGLAGSSLVRPLHRALRPGVLLIAVLAVEAPLVLALAVPWGPVWLGAVLCCAGLGLPALRVLVDVLIFQQVDDGQRGRVIAATIALFGLGTPVGIGAAGLLLEYLDPSGAMLVLGGFLALAAGYAGSRSRLRAARWPTG